ncbi:MAG: carboxymuconolactone decarboxylase family protein [Bacteroidetes bacterium]|nr:carboxymuconolactone decarboxylase family protein [Bacteroidota bacterium]
MQFVNPLPQNHSDEVSRLALFFNETLGFCPNSVLTMQIRPNIAKAFISLNMAVMENQGNVTSDFKRLLAFMSSHATGCRYCQAHTIRAAERYGASEEKLLNIWDYKTHPAYSAGERAALDLAIAASTVPNSVDDSLKIEVKKYWTDGDIVEIMGVIALFGFLNRWNDTMATTLELHAAESGDKWLKEHGWDVGKHQ